MKSLVICLFMTILLARPDAQSQWVQTNGPEGGEARCFVASGAGSNTVLFAGSNGGVFRSTDFGGHWVLASNGLAHGTVLGVAVEGPYLFALVSSQGIFRSSDNGNSWVAVNNGLSTLEVRAIGTNGSDVYLGTWRGGAFRSTNNGNSWLAVNNGLTNDVVTALVAYPDGGGGSFVFAGTQGGGVFRSTDNGATWTAAKSGIYGDWVTVYTFAAIPMGGGQTFLYTGTDYGAYRSTDNGATWESYGNGITTSYVIVLVGNSQMLFAGTRDMKGVFLSLNGGVSWEPINNGVPEDDVPALCLVPSADGSGHMLFAGIGAGGVYGTTDAGGSWSVLNTGFIANTGHRLATCGSTLFSATGARTIFRSTDEGASWTDVSFGLLGSGIQDLLSVPSPEGIGDPYLYAATYGDGVFRTTDRGIHWSQTSDGIEKYFILCLALLPKAAGGGMFLYAGDRNTVIRSTDYGDNWITVSSGLPASVIYALAAVKDPGEGGATTIFAGTFGSGVYRSTNDGANWTVANAGLSNLYVSNFATVPAIDGSGGTVLLARTSGGLYRSTNSGTSWSLANGLSIFRDFLTIGTTLYAATTQGAAFSTNSGTTWFDMSSGLDYRWMHSLTRLGTYIFAGSSGNGVWRHIIEDTPVPITLSSFTARPAQAREGVHLEWTTISEVNNYGFTVQRKCSGEFQDLPGAFIAGKGTTATPHQYTYRDTTISVAGSYEYRLKQQDLDGTVHYSTSVSVDVILTGVADAAPGEFRLTQNSPNPFNPSTVIRYTVGVVGGQPSGASSVKIVVYDLLGREVAVLVNGMKEPGTYSVVFNATGCSNGVYLCRMTAGRYTAVKKMLLLQ
jgi:hypothetical protein